MTSKSLFFKIVKQDVKKGIWCPIIMFLGYFLMLEVRMLLYIETLEQRGGSNQYYKSIGEYLAKGFFGSDTNIIVAISCFSALLCAMSSFAYLRSKSQLDAFHSLPVNRTQLFIAKYVSGVMQFFIPFLVNVIASIIIAARKGAISRLLFENSVNLIFVVLFAFLLTYATFIIAAALTGNLVVTILGGFVLFCYSSLFATMLQGMFSTFFVTYKYFYGLNDLTNKWFGSFSPNAVITRLLIPQNDAAERDAYFKYNADYVWVVAVFAFFYAVIAFVLYKKRASEAAGKAIAFKWAEPVIKTMLIIPLSFFSALFFKSVSSSAQNGDAWYLFGLIFGYIVFALLIEAIFRLDIKGALCHKRWLLFNAACVIVTFVIFKYDVLGYNTYIPADEKIESCAVSIENLMSTAPRIKSGRYISNANADTYRMKNVKIQNNPSVMELARKAAQQTAEALTAIDAADVGSVIENDGEKKYTTLLFGYNLKNGKNIYRRYYVNMADSDIARLLADVFNDSSYKIATNMVLAAGWKEEYIQLNCMGSFKSQILDMTPEFQARLLETYQEEYLQLDFATVLDTYPVGCITPIVYEEDALTAVEDVSSDPYSYYGGTDNGGLIYPQFTKTIALLKEYGFDIYEEPPLEDIESITVICERKTYAQNGLNENVATYDDIEIMSIYDDDRKKQVLRNLCNTIYGWQVDGFADYDDEFYVRIASKKGEINSSFRFKNGAVPGFVYESEGYKNIRE